MLIKDLQQGEHQNSYHQKTRNLKTRNRNTGMKKCELCSNIARIYCQSDNASLCYNCDQTVHSSNFLVAKHSRTLLCHKCQSPTPWTASGLHLGRAATVCVNCLDESSPQRRMMFGAETSHRENDVVAENRDVHENGDTDDDDTESSDESEDEDEDAENQVVPWSTVASPAPVTGCSSSEEVSSSRFSSDGFRSTTYRERMDAYIDSEDDVVCSSERSKRSLEISLTSFRPLKVIRSDRN